MNNKLILKAIKKINLQAEASVSGGDINTIVWENGTTPIPVADIQAQIPIVEQEIANEEANKLAKIESAKAKLTALGLDEEEVKAIIGV